MVQQKIPPPLEEPLKIRIIGLPDEATQAANLIARIFDVIEISGLIPCRGATRNVRIYAEVRLPQPAE
jgi:hypothetical protein